MNPNKPVFQNLVDQQIAVMRAVSYIIVVFMPLLLLTLYTVFGIKQTLAPIILIYTAGILLNILLLKVHKNAFITYVALIGFTFIEMIALILVTGGMASPILIILATLPGFAFYTSRKQGKIWFIICFVAAFFIFRSASFGIPVSDIVSDHYRPLLTLIIVLFGLFLTSVYLMLVKQDVSNAHKSLSSAAKALDEKTQRMENLIMLVNYSTELMCVIDRQTMTFDELNPEFKILLGYELSQLKGETIKKILKDEVMPFLAAIKEGDEGAFSSPVLCRNGEEKMFSWITVAKNGKMYTYGRSIKNK